MACNHVSHPTWLLPGSYNRRGQRQPLVSGSGWVWRGNPGEKHFHGIKKLFVGVIVWYLSSALQIFKISLLIIFYFHQPVFLIILIRVVLTCFFWVFDIIKDAILNHLTLVNFQVCLLEVSLQFSEYSFGATLQYGYTNSPFVWMGQHRGHLCLNTPTAPLKHNCV